MNREHEILLGINVNDRKRRDELIDKNGATLLDTYDAQLEEYMEICSLSDKDISSPKEVFIYYPWRNSIVRLLEQEAFERVRTNRNRNKITFEETKILQQKRVGVIGLSVGRSVSITMAQESIVGELRLADFDTLDLSNLNRIKAPLVDLGIKKTVSVQREIAELSPFLSVKTFDEGITLKNIEEFVGQGDNQLDLIIDECDSIEIKVLCRQVAKERGIPVIMDTSDRGLIDIERYDQDRDYPFFHGMAGDLSWSTFKEMPIEDRKALVFRILDFENLSERGRNSIQEIGTKLLTWPQLASDVTAGGGHATTVARNILLGKNVDSGRYYIDVEEIIGRGEKNS